MPTFFRKPKAPPPKGVVMFGSGSPPPRTFKVTSSTFSTTGTWISSGGGFPSYSWPSSATEDAIRRICGERTQIEISDVSITYGSPQHFAQLILDGTVVTGVGETEDVALREAFARLLVIYPYDDAG